MKDSDNDSLTQLDELLARHEGLALKLCAIERSV